MHPPKLLSHAQSACPYILPAPAYSFLIPGLPDENPDAGQAAASRPSWKIPHLTDLQCPVRRHPPKPFPAFLILFSPVFADESLFFPAWLPHIFQGLWLLLLHLQLLLRPDAGSSGIHRPLHKFPDSWSADFGQSPHTRQRPDLPYLLPGRYWVRNPQTQIRQMCHFPYGKYWFLRFDYFCKRFCAAGGHLPRRQPPY